VEIKTTDPHYRKFIWFYARKVVEDSRKQRSFKHLYSNNKKYVSRATTDVIAKRWKYRFPCYYRCASGVNFEPLHICLCSDVFIKYIQEMEPWCVFFTDDILLIGESREKNKVGKFGVNRVYNFSEKHKY
jgi:hypothetical protein